MLVTRYDTMVFLWDIFNGSDEPTVCVALGMALLTFFLFVFSFFCCFACFVIFSVLTWIMTFQSPWSGLCALQGMDGERRLELDDTISRIA